MHIIFFVLNSPEQLDDLLEAWEQVGIHGATIIESTGLHRQRSQSAPMRSPAFLPPSIPVEIGHKTLFVIVEDEQAVQACLEATERLIGDLTRPNTGVFAAWPLNVVKGFPKVTVEAQA